MNDYFRGFTRGLHWGMGFHLATKKHIEKIECPKCGETLPTHLKYPLKYCPYCGAKLKTIKEVNK